MPSFEQYHDDYAQRWTTMVVRSQWADAAKREAQRIIQARRHYEPVSGATGVPWHIIGILHLMECGGSFKGHLHNGDSLQARTHQVPAGRPLKGRPPFTWEESAIDALRYDGLDKVADWSPERVAWCLEKFNGFGYRSHGVPSAYLWSGSDQYSQGKYVADRVWSSSAVSGQVGGMVILKTLLAMEPAIADSDDLVAAARAFPKADKAAADESTPVPAPKPSSGEMRSVSRKWKLYDFLQLKYLFGGGGLATWLTASNIDATKAWADTVKSFGAEYGLPVLVLLCLLGWVILSIIKEFAKQDVAEGRDVPSGATEEGV